MLKNIFTGEISKNDEEIYFNCSKLKLPDGTIAKLLFDTGQFSAYFANWEDNSVISELDGVNNYNSVYLRDCEVI